jgi:hypothetical protein
MRLAFIPWALVALGGSRDRRAREKMGLCIAIVICVFFFSFFQGQCVIKCMSKDARGDGHRS